MLESITSGIGYSHRTFSCDLPLQREEFFLPELILHSDLRRRAASRLAVPCPSSYYRESIDRAYSYTSHMAEVSASHKPISSCISYLSLCRRCVADPAWLCHRFFSELSFRKLQLPFMYFIQSLYLSIVQCNGLD